MKKEKEKERKVQGRAEKKLKKSREKMLALTQKLLADGLINKEMAKRYSWR